MGESLKWLMQVRLYGMSLLSQARLRATFLIGQMTSASLKRVLSTFSARPRMMKRTCGARSFLERHASMERNKGAG